jgi:hypothetical protein
VPPPNKRPRSFADQATPAALPTGRSAGAAQRHFLDLRDVSTLPSPAVIFLGLVDLFISVDTGLQQCRCFLRAGPYGISRGTAHTGQRTRLRRWRRRRSARPVRPIELPVGVIPTIVTTTVHQHTSSPLQFYVVCASPATCGRFRSVVLPPNHIHSTVRDMARPLHAPSTRRLRIR